jgi:hypothetical protein
MTKPKKKKLSEAERIDRAIRNAAEKEAAREKAESEERLAKALVVAMTRRKGIESGRHSKVLSGKRWRSTVTWKQHLGAARELVETLPQPWRRELFDRVIFYEPTATLKQGFRRRSWLKTLPKRVREFLRRKVDVSNWQSVSFPDELKREVRK